MSVQAHRAQLKLARGVLQRLQDLAPDAQAAGLGRNPHALDLAASRRERTQRAAGGRLAEDLGHEEDTHRRGEVIELRRASVLPLESFRETGGELVEISLEAHARRGTVCADGCHFDARGTHKRRTLHGQRHPTRRYTSASRVVPPPTTCDSRIIRGGAPTATPL